MMKSITGRILQNSLTRKMYSLRIKIVLLILVPIVAVFILSSWLHYYQERQGLIANILEFSTSLGDLLLSSMRETMLVHTTADLEKILSHASVLGESTTAFIVNQNGIVTHANRPELISTSYDLSTPGCIECHKYAPANRPRSILTTQGDMLRISTPIINEAACHQCHQSEEKYLGALLVDISILTVQQSLGNSLYKNLAFSIIFTLVIIMILYLLIDWLVVRRIEKIHNSIQVFARGTSSIPQPPSTRIPDEITDLFRTFNQMTGEIALQQQHMQEVTRIRQLAIVNERERIARELHDGVAQFIAYLNAKLMAIRLLLQKGQTVEAYYYLDQIDQAVQDQSIDIRASIIGLKMVTQTGISLAQNLTEYITQCNRLSNVSINFIDNSVEYPIFLDPEVELHLLRIVQEAISNVRKHAQAQKVEVKLDLMNNQLLLSIHDDGVGFNPWQWNGNQPHFGLQTMRERAEIIKADFSVVSEPGCGTSITVQLNYPKDV